MYLHLGKNQSVSIKEIVGIFDIEIATISSDTKMFLKKKQEEKRIVNLSNDLPKSFIIAENELYESVFVSSVSVSSLNKRLEKCFKYPERNA